MSLTDTLIRQTSAIRFGRRTTALNGCRNGVFGYVRVRPPIQESSIMKKPHLMADFHGNIWP